MRSTISETFSRLKGRGIAYESSQSVALKAPMVIADTIASGLPPFLAFDAFGERLFPSEGEVQSVRHSNTASSGHRQAFSQTRTLSGVGG